jgi:hypothetical protein
MSEAQAVLEINLDEEDLELHEEDEDIDEETPTGSGEKKVSFRCWSQNSWVHSYMKHVDNCFVCEVKVLRVVDQQVVMVFRAGDCRATRKRSRA